MTESAVEIEGVPNLSLSDGQRSAIQCFLLSWVSEDQAGLEGLLEGLLGTFRLPNFEGTAVDVQPPTIQLNGAITTSLEDSEREETGTVVVYPFKRNFPKDERADFGSFAYTATLGLCYVTFDSTKDPLEQPRQGVISTEFHFCLDLLKLAGQGLRAWLRQDSGLPAGFDDAKARLVKRIDCQASPTAVSVGDLAVWLVKELFELAAVQDRAAVPAYLNGLLNEQDGRIKTIWQVLDAISFTPTAVPQRRDAMCNLQAKSIGAGLPVSHRWSLNEGNGEGMLLVNFSIPNPDLGHSVEDSYAFDIAYRSVLYLQATLDEYRCKTNLQEASSQDLSVLPPSDPFQLLNQLASALLTAEGVVESVKTFLVNVAAAATQRGHWDPGFSDDYAELKLKGGPAEQTPTIYSLKFKPVIDEALANWCIELRGKLRVAAAR